jgi:hypothetical protein
VACPFGDGTAALFAFDRRYDLRCERVPFGVLGPHVDAMSDQDGRVTARRIKGFSGLDNLAAKVEAPQTVCGPGNRWQIATNTELSSSGLDEILSRLGSQVGADSSVRLAT